LYESATNEVTENSNLTYDGTDFTVGGTGAIIAAGSAGLKLGVPPDFVQELYVHGVSLSNTITPVTVSEFNLPWASYLGQFIEYRIYDGTDTRVGTLLVSTNSTTATVVDYFTETGLLGVTWTAVVGPTNVAVQYANSGTAAVMHAAIRRFQVD
jgi:hypothetical protein